MVGEKFGSPKFSKKCFFEFSQNFKNHPNRNVTAGIVFSARFRVERGITPVGNTDRRKFDCGQWKCIFRFWKNLIKRSIIFFPAFDRSIECISHMTYDMDSKTFFCQQNLSKLLWHAKKNTKKCVSRIYICKKWIFWWFFWRLHFSDSDLTYTLFPSDASRHSISAQEK